jgi:prevent-host-death family protein
MDITKDIQPMITFRNHSAEIMRHLKDTKRPVILTVNGKAAAVVQDAEAYQNLLDLAGGGRRRRRHTAGARGFKERSDPPCARSI